MIPTLTTERLTLRAPRLDDLDAYAEYGASERSRSVGGPFSRGDAFSRLCALLGHWHLRGFGRWIIADRETDAPLGVSGLFYPEGWPEPEIAWTVFADAEGRGIAHEAATEVRRHAYHDLGWTTVMSAVAPANTRSVALARRLGATLEGEFTHVVHGRLGIWRHLPPSEVPA